MRIINFTKRRRSGFTVAEVLLSLFAIGAVIAFVFILLARYLDLKGSVQTVFNWIGASGGLWAFCNLAVNLWGRLSK